MILGLLGVIAAIVIASSISYVAGQDSGRREKQAEWKSWPEVAEGQRGQTVERAQFGKYHFATHEPWNNSNKPWRVFRYGDVFGAEGDLISFDFAHKEDAVRMIEIME